MSSHCPYCAEPPTAIDVDGWFTRIEAMIDAREKTIVEALNANTTRTLAEYQRMAGEVASARAEAQAARKDSQSAMAAVKATESQIAELRAAIETLRCPPPTEPAPPPEIRCVHCRKAEEDHADEGHAFRGARP